MLRVIIESPYAGEIERNTGYARDALRHSLSLGEAPFASHLLYTQVLDDRVPQERDRGLQAGYEWMETADIVAFYIDYGWSPGMLKALKVARLLHRRIEARAIIAGAKRVASDKLDINALLEHTRAAGLKPIYFDEDGPHWATPEE